MKADYCMEEGFLWAEFENGKKVQACLVAGVRRPFRRQIDVDDCGFDWGICGDFNSKYFDLTTEEGRKECKSYIKLAAKKAGVQVLT